MHTIYKHSQAAQGHLIYTTLIFNLSFYDDLW